MSVSSERLLQTAQRETGSGLHLLLTREVEPGPTGLLTGWNPVEQKGGQLCLLFPASVFPASCVSPVSTWRRTLSASSRIPNG